MDMSLSKLWETVKDRKAWQAIVHEDANSRAFLQGIFPTQGNLGFWLGRQIL